MKLPVALTFSGKVTLRKILPHHDTLDPQFHCFNKRTGRLSLQVIGRALNIWDRGTT